MGRREALLRLGGFDESLQDLYDDQTLIAKLALHCRIRVDAVLLERYRQHEGLDAPRDPRGHLPPVAPEHRPAQVPRAARALQR